MFLNYDLDLKLSGFDQSNLFFQLEQVSNDTYLKVFDTHVANSEAKPDNLESMDNKIKFSLSNQNFITLFNMAVLVWKRESFL